MTVDRSRFALKGQVVEKSARSKPSIIQSTHKYRCVEVGCEQSNYSILFTSGFDTSSNYCNSQ